MPCTLSYKRARVKVKQLHSYLIVHIMLNPKDVQKHRKRFTKKDETVSALFKVLGDTNRYRIFLLLTESPKFSIGSIAKILDISLPLASQHIRLMVHAHVLQKKRDGKRVYIQLDRHNLLLTTIRKALQRA